MWTTGPTCRYQIKSPTHFLHVRRRRVFGSLPSRQETEPSPLIGCWGANSAHEDFGDTPLLLPFIQRPSGFFFRNGMNTRLRKIAHRRHVIGDTIVGDTYRPPLTGATSLCPLQ